MNGAVVYMPAHTYRSSGKKIDKLEVMRIELTISRLVVRTLTSQPYRQSRPCTSLHTIIS